MRWTKRELLAAKVEAGLTFYDYVIRFGPGSLFKFGVALDKSGAIGSLSFG